MIPLFGESEAGGTRDILEGRLVWLAEALGAQASVLYLAVDPPTQLARIAARCRIAPAASPG